MGWGLRKAPEREKLTSDHHVEQEAAVGYAAVVVDMCSEARRIGSSTRPQNAVQFAERLTRGLLKSTTWLVVAMFDCKERMHSERSTLHARRYKTLSVQEASAAEASGKVVIGGSAYAEGSEPYTMAEVAGFSPTTPLVWTRLWASSHGKDASWELLYAGMIMAHHKLAPRDNRFVMWLRGKPHVWPYKSADVGDVMQLAAALCDNTHGEGDQRVCAAAQVLVSHGCGDVLVQTVDTDMLLQMLCTRGWADAGSAAGRLHLKLKNEVVDMGSFMESMGASEEERVSAAFWGMACGGVDYCKGLTRFGYKTVDLLGCMESAVAVVTVDGEGVTVDTRALLRALSSLGRRKMKRVKVEHFVEEVNAMAFCVALFSGAGAKNDPCGGPVKPIADFAKPHDLTRIYDDAFVKWGGANCARVFVANDPMAVE